MGTQTGKIAWITGAGSGIGRAAAKALAGAGAGVILSGRRLSELQKTADAITTAGGTAETASLDVTDHTAVLRAANDIATRKGKIDILVNCAGLNVSKRYWPELTIEDWDKVIDINLNGAFYCTRAVLDGMRARKAGLIIHVSSWAGVYDLHLSGPAYNASKRAMVAMSNSINMSEGKNGIRSCCICPGEVATDILRQRPVPPSAEDMARMLKEDDLGRAVQFVAETPAHACINEIIISPTWNRLYAG